MGKNRNRIVNRQEQANGVAAATVAAKESADNLALAVEWMCRAEFGPSLAYLMAGYYVFLYVRGALTKERERTGGGGNLAATRVAAKKIAEGRFLEATGNNSSTLPDMDILIKTYSAYSLLSGQQEPSASTCEAPWSGFRDLGRLVYRKDAESEGWAFAEIVDQAKARAVFTDWLLTRPRVKVSELVASVSSLLGLAPKTPAAKPITTPDNPVVTVVPVAPGETPATLAEAPLADPSAPVIGATPAAPESPANAVLAAEDRKPDSTEATPPNPNYIGGAMVSTADQTTPGTQEEAPKSDLPRPADRKPEERKADVNAIAFDGKPENVAEQFLEVLLSYDDPKDGHRVMSALGRLLGHESMEKNTLLASLLEAYCDVSQDVDTLQGIAELTGTKADELTDARQPAVAAVA